MNNTDIIKDIRRYRARLHQAQSISEFQRLKLPHPAIDEPDDPETAADLDRRCANNPELGQALLAKFIEDEVLFYAQCLMREVNAERLAPALGVDTLNFPDHRGSKAA